MIAQALQALKAHEELDDYRFAHLENKVVDLSAAVKGVNTRIWAAAGIVIAAQGSIILMLSQRVLH